MLRHLRLNRVYVAGPGGVRVVHHDGSIIERAEGYQLSLDRWPQSIEGQFLDSRGRVVTLSGNMLRRRYEDKVFRV
jgi:hypothetical protein